MLSLRIPCTTQLASVTTNSMIGEDTLEHLVDDWWSNFSFDVVCRLYLLGTIWATYLS